MYSLLLLLLCNIKTQAQETDSLWTSFIKELDKGVKTENEMAYINRVRISDYNYDSRMNIIGTILDTPIEDKAIDYMFIKFRLYSLVNVRSHIRQILYEIAYKSNNHLSRKKAINYMFDIYDTSIYPKLKGLWIDDFDEELKLKVMRLINHKYSDEELSFFSETIVKQEMLTYKVTLDYQIKDTIKKYKNIFLYDEVKEKMYQLEVNKIKNDFLNNNHIQNVCELFIIAAQLNIMEAIPYLKIYADSEINNDSYKYYAICGLASLRVDDYEQKSLMYFDIDTYDKDIWIPQIINSQYIWYAYLRRLQSEKYLSKCPVSYLTMRDLATILLDFPLRYPSKDTTLATGLFKNPEPYLITDDCGISEEPIPIDKEVIKIAIDWMEKNKGKYELQHKIIKTF